MPAAAAMSASWRIAAIGDSPWYRSISTPLAIAATSAACASARAQDQFAPLALDNGGEPRQVLAARPERFTHELPPAGNATMRQTVHRRASPITVAVR